MVCLTGWSGWHLCDYPALEAELWALPQERQPHLVSSYMSKEGSCRSIGLSPVPPLGGLPYCWMRLWQAHEKEGLGECRWLRKSRLKIPTSHSLLCPNASLLNFPQQCLASSGFLPQWEVIPTGTPLPVPRGSLLLRLTLSGVSNQTCAAFPVS